MGIPAFSSWLLKKYPQIIDDMVGYYSYDNLYLDMTEIIYHVLHPTDGPSPVSANQVFFEICNYIDRVIAMVRPRKLIYMAFDGVAPRAKMNEQRCRRFISAKNASEAELEEDKLRKKFQNEGKKLPVKNNFKRVYFSHLVAAGTSFMANLSTYLKNYIYKKLSYDWKNIKVILSDANVPGEGEQKIMSFIRRQKNLPGYDRNAWHCIFGSDSDLILLALATHEIQFSILRSTVVEGNDYDVTGAADIKIRRYQFLHLFTLREYLRGEIMILNSNIKIDNFERRLDDFICLCLFLGNDFLPGILNLDIWEGAVDLLLSIYKSHIVNHNIYLTEKGNPDLKNIQKFMGVLGEHEEDTFKKRSLEHKRRIQSFKFRNLDSSSCDSTSQLNEEISKSPRQYKKGANGNQVNKNTKDMKEKLKELLNDKTDTFRNEYKLDEDKVKWEESGWKKRFFSEKFLATGEKIDVVRKEVVLKYMQGICWLMKYYYQGVVSWAWYYPYYYAPFASDLKDFGDCEVSFELGCPLKPYTHMLATSPSTNSASLPTEYRKLIMNADSPIKDLYPKEFEIDTDGKRYTWQGIVKLPFVDENRLIAEVAKIEDTLTVEERLLNSRTTENVFIPAPVATQFRGRLPLCSTNINYGRNHILNNFQYYIY